MKFSSVPAATPPTTAGEASRIPGESTLGGLKSLSVIFLLLLNFNNFNLSELQSSAINVCSFQTTCHPGTTKLDQIQLVMPELI